MLTLAAVLAVFVYGLNSALLGALLPSYSLSAGQQGNLGLANALGLVIASLSGGPLVDFQGKKIAIVLGLSLVCAGLVWAPNADGYFGLLGAYFTLGMGGGIVTTGANSLVGDMTPERRASALNFLNLFFGLGGIVTTYAASYLFKAAMLCYGIAALAALAVLTNAVARVEKGEAEFRLNEVPALLSHRALILLSLLLFLYVACEVGVWNWLKAYLISIHFDPQTAGGIVSYGFAFGMLIGRLTASRILITIQPVNVVLASGLLMVVTTFVMLHVGSRTGVTVAVFTAGFSMAPVFPTVLAMVANSFPRGTATAMGIAITSGWIGLAASSPIIGSIAASGTLRHALLLLPALASAMVLVNLVLRFNMRITATA
jgi:fucose permease